MTATANSQNKADDIPPHDHTVWMILKVRKGMKQSTVVWVGSHGLEERFSIRSGGERGLKSGRRCPLKYFKTGLEGKMFSRHLHSDHHDGMIELTQN